MMSVRSDPLRAVLAVLFLAAPLGSLGAKPSPEVETDAAQPPALSPSEFDSLAGQLLVATPEMGDPRFSKTVIVMVRHDHTGALGLVINKLIGSSTLADLLAGFGEDGHDIADIIAINYGGPVQPLVGLSLHSPDFASEGTTTVNDYLSMSSGVEVLKAMAEDQGPRNILFMLGYAGWGPGQLEGELQRRSWAIAPADEAFIFIQDPGTGGDEKWKKALDRMQIDL
jgi:putative transcriptional regulator